LRRPRGLLPPQILLPWRPKPGEEGREPGWLVRYRRLILMVVFAAFGVRHTVKGAAGAMR